MGDFHRGGGRGRGRGRGNSRFSDGPSEDDYVRNLESMKNAQTSKVDRKLYVGNLPAGITQTHLVDLLNTALINKNLNAYPGSPVLSAWISQDGHYAFVEFRSIEEANSAFALNNYPILGQNLKVGRPKTYAGAQPASVAARSTSPDRHYHGRLHHHQHHSLRQPDRPHQAGPAQASQGALAYPRPLLPQCLQRSSGTFHAAH